MSRELAIVARSPLFICLEDKAINIEHASIPDAQLHPVKGAAGATIGLLSVANGAGDAPFVSPFNACGEMYINGNTSATTVVAAVDPTLATDSDYVLVAAGWASTSLVNMGFTTDHLIAQKAGTYLLTVNGDVSTTGASRTAIKVRVNSTNKLNKTIIETSTAYNGISQSILLTLAINDTVSLYIANTVGNVTVRDITLNLVRLGIL